VRAGHLSDRGQPLDRRRSTRELATVSEAIALARVGQRSIDLSSWIVPGALARHHAVSDVTAVVRHRLGGMIQTRRPSAIGRLDATDLVGARPAEQGA
jgi:hypothetical protein